MTDDSGQFGSTTRDINGAIECSASYIGNTPQKRYQIFDALAQAVGLTGVQHEWVLSLEWLLVFVERCKASIFLLKLSLLLE